MSPWTQTSDKPDHNWFAEVLKQARISHDTTCMDKVDCNSLERHVDQAFLIPSLRRTVEHRDMVIKVHKEALRKASEERDPLRAQKTSSGSTTDGFSVLTGVGWFMAASGLCAWAFGGDRFGAVAIVAAGVATVSAVIGALHRRRKAGA